MNTTQAALPVASHGWGTRILQFPLTRIILPIAMIFGSLFGSGLLIKALVPEKSMRVAWPYLVLLSVCFGIYYLYVRLAEKRVMDEFSRRGALPELARGILWGSVLLSTVMTALAACDAYHVTGVNSWTVMLAPLPEIGMVALMEEIVFRGILFRVIEQSLGTWSALILSSLVFGAAHLGNDGVNTLGILNVVMAGAMLAGAYMLTRRLWLSIGLHFAWDYLLMSLFSVTVSGHPGYGLLESSVTGPEWLTGGALGVEASAVAVSVITSATVHFVVTAMAQKPFVLPFWKRAKVS
jgi:membrane protease YdiL (CAAX protease family)